MRRALLCLLLAGASLAQTSLDSVLVQMLNQPSEQWVVTLSRSQGLKGDDVVPAVKRSLQLAVKGQDRESAEMMRAIDYIDWYLGGKKEYKGLGQLTLATYFLQQHLPAKASPVLDTLLKQHPENHDGWVLLGHVYMESDPLRSIEMFRKATELDPQVEGAFLGLGQAYFLVGRNQDAIKAYRKALELNPDNGMARDAIKYLQNPKEAQAVRARTEEGNRHFLQAEALYARGKYAEAIKEYDLALKADARFSKAWTYKGDAYYQLGQYDRAMECYRQAVKWDARDKQAWRKLGDVLERRFHQSSDPKHLEESIACYQKALKIDPNYGSAQDDLARALKLRAEPSTTPSPASQK